MTNSLAPYDSVLLLSFGGPDGPPDVMPFLENVSRGRNIPRDRLLEVEQHYLNFGGISPINGQNRDLIAELQRDFENAQIDVPIYWGNRNWRPFLVDALREIARAGHKRPLVLVTSAYSSYSGCRQYREDLALALDQAQVDLEIDKVAQYFDAEGFIAANVAAIEAELGARSAHLVFVTHSLPHVLSQTSGREDRRSGIGGDYVAQHEAVAAEIVRRLQAAGREVPGWSLAFCSRSGPPNQPWLEPDVNDHLQQLANDGVSSVCLIPIGFVSDHMEVVFDLDTQARQTAADLEMDCFRSATVGTHPLFVKGLVDLLLSRAASARGEVDFPSGRIDLGFAASSPCAANCCSNARANLPALCGAKDWQDN